MFIINHMFEVALEWLIAPHNYLPMTIECAICVKFLEIHTAKAHTPVVIFAHFVFGESTAESHDDSPSSQLVTWTLGERSLHDHLDGVPNEVPKISIMISTWNI